MNPNRFVTSLVLVVCMPLLVTLSPCTSRANTPTSTTVPNFSPPADYVPIPGGYAHPSCVHTIPNGSHVGVDSKVRDATGKILAQYEDCHHPMIRLGNKSDAEKKLEGLEAPNVNGWIEGNQQGLPSGATTWNYYYSIITVPDAPEHPGNQQYYFGGVESPSGNQILQPVLQYGHSDDGGGNYWEFAAWMVGPGSSEYASTLAGASVGDSIITEMYLSSTYVCSGRTCCEWYVGAYDEANANYSAGYFDTSQLMPFMFPAVYEAYNKGDCQDPGDIHFDVITLGANTSGGVPIMWAKRTVRRVAPGSSTLARIQAPGSVASGEQAHPVRALSFTRTESHDWIFAVSVVTLSERAFKPMKFGISRWYCAALIAALGSTACRSKCSPPPCPARGSFDQASCSCVAGNLPVGGYGGSGGGGGPNLLIPDGGQAGAP